VTEVAGWVPAPWRQAVMWTSHVPELPIIDALLKGATPKWIRQDPVFAALTETDLRKRSAALANSLLDPLVASGVLEETFAARWYTHWRLLWPQHRMADHKSALFDLAATINAHVERLYRAGTQETSAPYRRDLARSVTRIFRRHSASPAAVFSHLALVALDLERLRGDLIRRRLFEPSHATEAR